MGGGRMLENIHIAERGRLLSLVQKVTKHEFSLLSQKIVVNSNPRTVAKHALKESLKLNGWNFRGVGEDLGLSFVMSRVIILGCPYGALKK